MLPWNPPASLSMQQGQGGGGNGIAGGQNELHSIGMQHQQQGMGGGAGAGQHFNGGGGGPAGQQQQMLQQQQQGQHQQQQNGSGQGVPGQQNQQPQLSLSQVLHFLQTEWRRYERERNEWEIERGEMRARIALLEGERRGTENLKTDLMRRVKMLEYALRTERNKYLTTTNQQNAINKEKDALAQKAAEDKEKEKEKDKDVAGQESTNEGSPKEGDANKVKEGDEKEKPSAISQDKKKLMKEQTGASGRASPLPAVPSDETAANAASVPDVVVSATNTAAGSAPGAQQQTGAGVQRVSSIASIASMPNGHASVNINAGGSNTMNLGPLSWNPSLGRDPRGRAKSREYLKQCLQEITYLTSATSLNPLPERTPAGMQRPRKLMQDVPAPPPQAVSTNPASAVTFAQPQAPALSAVPEPQTVAGNTIIPLAQASAGPPIPVPSAPLNMTTSTSESMSAASDITADGNTSATSVTVTSPNSVPSALPPAPGTRPTFAVPQNAADIFSVMDGPNGDDASANQSDAASRLTAIFRPESSEEWKKALQKAGTVSNGQVLSEQDQASKPFGTTIALKDLSREVEGPSTARNRSDTVQSAASTATVKADSVDDHKIWKPRRTLRAHLDAVRCLAFDRSERNEDVCMATGSDDCTVKLWRVPLQSISAINRTQPLQDSEPALTYRGHTAPVTAVCMSSTPGSNRIYSSSLDSTIQIWRLPPREREAYAPFDASLNAMRLEGHTDGVWDVCLLNSGENYGSASGAAASNGPDPKKEMLASASADGTVKIWDVSPTDDALSQSGSGGALRLSWTAAGVDGAEDSTSKPIPTSLAVCQTDMTKLAVAYQDGKIRLFDTETGKLVMTLHANEAPAAQVNRIVSHPTLPMLITANEDNYIRLFDLKSGQCTYSLVGHTDVVTSLDVDPSGLTIASASHDCTVRFWDLLQTRSCIQEISNSHRQKADEGVLDVKYHPTLPFVASSGADGGVRIYG